MQSPGFDLLEVRMMGLNKSSRLLQMRFERGR